MNIVLTQKDADWVANVIRDRIKDLEETKDEFIQSNSNHMETLEKIADILGISDEQEVKEGLDEAQKDLVSAQEEIQKKYTDKLNEYQKIIELMMIGSV